jgi:lipopolysaccharide transport system ATP-binding protein
MVRGRQIIAGDEVEEFWALKDVSFEIKRGEVVGIIGRNGAGKSTLLKILSRITEPSAGRVTIKGRVASLLEVGTGFHPELTGRENIYLNGAILGMGRAEIKRKFDEIVAFAEVEKFLDTPVKRYSSGMYVRLAFAVAAHLEPEILVVDEVLAVGDAEFQKKCLGKMQHVANHGRTVLFVSHNMAAVSSLCPITIYLKAGRLAFNGPTLATMRQYANSVRDDGARGPGNCISLGDGFSIERVEIYPEPPLCGSDVEIRFSFSSSKQLEISEAAVLIYAGGGTRAAISDMRRDRIVPLKLPAGLTTLKMKLNNIPLVEGDYSVGLFLVTDQFSGNLFDLATFSLQPVSTEDNWVRYPASSRGIVDLAYTASVSTAQ